MTDLIILFDDTCLLCNSVVRFIIANDPRAICSFAALRSETAHKLMQGKLSEEYFGETMILVEGEAYFARSEAVLRIARRLRMPWPLLGVLTVIPKAVRDGVYYWIAHHRYGWFGRTDKCLLSSSEQRDRFL